MTKYKVVLVPFPCLMTATTALIRRELGQLSPRMQTQVNDRLRKLFDLK